MQAGLGMPAGVPPGLAPDELTAIARWTPPMPRLAIDSYWRSRPLRADRLARTLAAQSGAPRGWSWSSTSNPPSSIGSSARSTSQPHT